MDILESLIRTAKAGRFNADLVGRSNMNTVIINGESFSIKGNNVSIINGKITVDGKDYTPDAKNISIQITGNVENINVDYCESIGIVGDVKEVESTNGNIAIEGNVSGDVETTNGNINCLNVGGKVKTTNGNIKYKKD